jgi:hypothetical protein
LFEGYIQQERYERGGVRQRFSYKNASEKRVREETRTKASQQNGRKRRGRGIEENRNRHMSMSEEVAACKYV